MAVTLGLSARLAEFFNAQEVPVVVIGKLREIKVVEVSDFVGLAAHAQDLGGSFQLPKLEDITPEIAIRTKMCVRRIWSGCKVALNPPQSHWRLVGINPAVNSTTH